MTNVLVIDGKEYTPATIAGPHFGYTKDYLLMLIKGGKIDGQKIGNKWYVHEPSTKIFFEEAAEKRKEKRRHMSEERKAELYAYTRDRIHSVSLEKSAHRKSISHVRMAIAETCMVVLIGFSLGTTAYMGSVNHIAAVQGGGEPNFFKYIAISLYDFINPQKEIAPSFVPIEGASRVENNGVGAPTEDISIERTTATATPSTTTEAFIVAPEDALPANSVGAIRESFSDDVMVTPDSSNPDTGVVVPIFKDGEGESYRFLMVPINAEGGTSENKVGE